MAETIVETTIREVTIYTNQALVSRHGRITLGAGASELVLRDLPVSLDTDSVRVSGTGTTAVSIMGVRTERAYTAEPVAESVADLERQIRDLENQAKALTDEIDAINLQRSFVKGLSEEAVGRFATGLARQQTDLNATDALLGFLGNRWSERSQEIARLTHERDDLNAQLTALRKRLDQIRQPQSRESISLFVAINAVGDGDFDLEASYVVYSAGWTPLYDLRVETDSGKVGLTYLANVRQWSGEDWPKVRLTLSTAKPGLGSLPPKLSPWYVDVYTPPIPSPMAMSAPMLRSAKAYSTASGMAAFGDASDTFDMSMQTSAPAPIEAEMVSADMNSEGGVVTFSIAGDNDIPSDGEPHKTTIFSDDYGCKLEFIAMPRLVSQSYLRATVTNGGAQLLAGDATIFRNNTFIGKTRLASVAPREEFKLNLGIDESIKVERELIEREVDKTFIGNTRRTTFGYRITLTSLRDVETQITLNDQLPVSRNEAIKVRLSRSQPPIQPGEMGVLEWKLLLPPRAKQSIAFQFVVEHPRDLPIIGLNV